jgi:hypothetical protein
MAWKKINDKNVRHVWMCKNEECEDYGTECHISPEWYQNNGTPVCNECDVDMVYVGTEILEEIS